MTMRLDLSLVRLVAGAMISASLCAGTCESRVLAQSSERQSVFAGEGAMVAPRIDPAAWRRVETAHFALTGDVPGRALRSLAADLEALESLLAALNPADSTPSPPAAEIYVFASRETFSRYALYTPDGEPAPVSGFFIAHPHGDFIAVSAAAGRSARGALYHEVLHRFLRHHLPEAPLWLNEGLAEFYSTLEVERGAAWVGRPVVEHVVQLQRASRHPIAELLEVDTGSPAYLGGDPENAFYAESWALVHYLLAGEDGGRAAVARYAGLLRADEEPLAAFATVFGDRVDLERRVDEHLRRAPREPMQVVLDQPVVTADLPVAPVAPADLDYRLGWLLSHHSPPRGASALSHFEAALRTDPAHAGAVTGIGWLDELQGDHDSARRQYTRAIELDPRDPLPRFLAAQSLLRSAGSLPASERESNASRALYEAAREGFRRCLELEPGLAEAWAGLGAAWVADRSPASEGLEALREAYHRLPTRDDVLYNLMLLEARLGSRKQAAALFARLERRAQPERVEHARESLLRVDLSSAERLLSDGRTAEAVVIMSHVLAETGDRELAAVLASRLETLERGPAGGGGHG